MDNKWSLYEDSETVRYSFDCESVESFLELLKGFVTICEDSEISKLIIRGSYRDEHIFSDKVMEFLKFIEDLKNENSRGVYPRVSSYGVYNYSKDTFFDYVFSNELYVYNNQGRIVSLSMTQDSLYEELVKIRHGQMNQRGFSLPFEFETYYGLTPSGVIKSYDFLIHFNSDIWLDEVPCVHCEKSYSNENLRNLGGLSSVQNYWHDNKELSQLNLEKINSFMSGMNDLCHQFAGEIHIEELRLYQRFFGRTLN